MTYRFAFKRPERDNHTQLCVPCKTAAAKHPSTRGYPRSNSINSYTIKTLWLLNGNKLVLTLPHVYVKHCSWPPQWNPLHSCHTSLAHTCQPNTPARSWRTRAWLVTNTHFILVEHRWISAGLHLHLHMHDCVFICVSGWVCVSDTFHCFQVCPKVPLQFAAFSLGVKHKTKLRFIFRKNKVEISPKVLGNYIALFCASCALWTGQKNN